MAHLPKVIAELAESYILSKCDFGWGTELNYGTCGHWELAMGVEKKDLDSVIYGACWGDHNELAHALLDRAGCASTSCLLAAVKNRNIGLVNIMIPFGVKIHRAIDYAAQLGDVWMCRLLLPFESRPGHLGIMIREGARQGRFDMIALGIQNGARITDDVLRLAGQSCDWGIMLMLCHGSCSRWMTAAEGVIESGNVCVLKKCIDRIQSLTNRENGFYWICGAFAEMCANLTNAAAPKYYECMNVLLQYGVDQCVCCGDINRHRSEIESYLLD